MDGTASKPARYTYVAMAFHWIIAGLVIWNWRIAEAGEHASSRAEAPAIFADHKAIGITILLLTLGRLAWRLAHPVPPLPTEYAQWERVLARTTHVIFYVMLLGLPLAGWLANSMYGNDIDMFGLFTIPALPVAQNADAASTVYDIHKTAGTITIYLVGLHILGGLKHTIFDRTGGLSRMLPFGRTSAPRT